MVHQYARIKIKMDKMMGPGFGIIKMVSLNYLEIL